MILGYEFPKYILKFGKSDNVLLNKIFGQKLDFSYTHFFGSLSIYAKEN